MAEEVVVKEPLTSEMIEAGKRLTQQLDASGFNATATFWFFYPETGYWKFVTVSPQVESEGPSKTYEAIQKVLAILGDDFTIPLFSIKVLAPRDTLAQSLRLAVRTDPKAVSGVRFTRNRINDIFVEDAFIYRAA